MVFLQFRQNSGVSFDLGRKNICRSPHIYPWRIFTWAAKWRQTVVPEAGFRKNNLLAAKVPREHGLAHLLGTRLLEAAFLNSCWMPIDRRSCSVFMPLQFLSSILEVLQGLSLSNIVWFLFCYCTYFLYQLSIAGLQTTSTFNGLKQQFFCQHFSSFF